VEAELSSPLVEGLLFKFLALTTAPQALSYAVISLVKRGICRFLAEFDDFRDSFENSPVIFPVLLSAGTESESSLGRNRNSCRQPQRIHPAALRRIAL
jgi:hypothetical protein